MPAEPAEADGPGGQGEPDEAGLPRRAGASGQGGPDARGGGPSHGGGTGPGGPWLANLPYAVVFGGVAGGLAWVWLSKTHVQGGVMTMAGSLFAAALARLVLRDERAGLLVARRRAVDVAAFAILGAGLLAAALVIPQPS
jgi:hypothetical protein